LRAKNKLNAERGWIKALLGVSGIQPGYLGYSAPASLQEGASRLRGLAHNGME